MTQQQLSPEHAAAIESLRFDTKHGPSKFLVWRNDAPPDKIGGGCLYDLRFQLKRNDFKTIGLPFGGAGPVYPLSAIVNEHERPPIQLEWAKKPPYTGDDTTIYWVDYILPSLYPTLPLDGHSGWINDKGGWVFQPHASKDTYAHIYNFAIMQRLPWEFPVQHSFASWLDGRFDDVLSCREALWIAMNFVPLTTDPVNPLLECVYPLGALEATDLSTFLPFTMHGPAAASIVEPNIAAQMWESGKKTPLMKWADATKDFKISLSDLLTLMRDTREKDS